MRELKIAVRCLYGGAAFTISVVLGGAMITLFEGKQF